MRRECRSEGSTGCVVSVIVVSRALSLPRRTWVPRTDERPRLVMIPGDPAAWFLARGVAEAEHYRSRWSAG